MLLTVSRFDSTECAFTADRYRTDAFYLDTNTRLLFTETTCANHSFFSVRRGNQYCPQPSTAIATRAAAPTATVQMGERASLLTPPSSLLCPPGFLACPNLRGVCYGSARAIACWRAVEAVRTRVKRRNAQRWRGRKACNACVANVRVSIATTRNRGPA